MTSLVSVIGILFGLHFVSYQCEGALNIANGGNVRYAVPGENVTIEWSLGTSPTNTQVRLWTFTRTKVETIARIFADEKEEIPTSSLAGVKVKKPATLILSNVNESYNGTYKFQFIDNNGKQDTSSVSLFIAVKPTVTIDCSSVTIVGEGDDVRCLCEGEGNPPAIVTWYKDGVQIGVVGNEEEVLTLIHVTGANNGTYKCVAQSYTLKESKSIQVEVRPNFAPVVISLTSNPKKAVLGQSVIITCEASARPSPTYTIIFNGTVIYIGTENTFTIQTVKKNSGGLYTCIAKNKVGTSKPKVYNLTVLDPAFELTTTATTGTTYRPSVKNSATETAAACSKSNGGTEWYIVVVSLLSGFIIGILFSLILGCSRRRILNTKHNSNSEPQTSNVNSIYQDLDLSKMNSEDNYQSLRMNSAKNDADYKNQNDSTYTELNNVRDVENNYQSLT